MLTAIPGGVSVSLTAAPGIRGSCSVRSSGWNSDGWPPGGAVVDGGTGEGKGRRCRCAGGRVLAPFRESPANVEYLVMGMLGLEYVDKEVEGRRNSSADANPGLVMAQAKAARNVSGDGMTLGLVLASAGGGLLLTSRCRGANWARLPNLSRFAGERSGSRSGRSSIFWRVYR